MSVQNDIFHGSVNLGFSFVKILKVEVQIIFFNNFFYWKRKKKIYLSKIVKFWWNWNLFTTEMGGVVGYAR